MQTIAFPRALSEGVGLEQRRWGMTGLRRHRHWSLIPAFLWLVLQSLMVAGLAAVPARAGAAAEPLAAQMVVICSPDGPIEVSAADFFAGVIGAAEKATTGQPGSAADKPAEPADHDGTAHADCGSCQAFGTGLAPGRSGPFARAAPVPERHSPSAKPVTVGHHHPSDAFESRAPPV